MGKHAYLIIAHNEFDALQRLVTALDSEDNDIYVHIDRKVKVLPVLHAAHSRLEILKERHRVYWGHYTQVETETAMLKAALSTGIDYEYLHFISGVHYPLKSKKDIRQLFDSIRGQSLVVPMPDDNNAIQMKLGRYHFFIRSNKSNNQIIQKIGNFLWRGILFMQSVMGIFRDTSYYGGKVSQWCSLTMDAARYWLRDHKKIRRRFRKTFCADEYVFMSILKEHNLPVVKMENYLFLDFCGANPRTLNEHDYVNIKNSGAYFGRKFTKESKLLYFLIDNNMQLEFVEAKLRGK